MLIQTSNVKKWSMSQKQLQVSYDIILQLFLLYVLLVLN